MIKWSVIVSLPDNLSLGEAIKIKQTIEKCGLPTVLKIDRVTSELKPNPEGKQIWLIR